VNPNTESVKKVHFSINESEFGFN